MPYEFSFKKLLDAADPDRYINECCIGGDIVSSALLPSLQARYGAVETGQEDWGWYMWSASDGLRLAVDIFTDDYTAGRYRARLTTSKRALFGGRKELDTPALEELKQVVNSSLAAWLGSAPLVEHVD